VSMPSGQLPNYMILTIILILSFQEASNALRNKV
jgi:hypothetical protein